MPSNVSCPVCNKAGLQDYTATPTVCPQCNSDLKPYLLLHSVAKANSKKATLFTLGVAFLVCLFAILYFTSLPGKKQIANDNRKTIKQFQDSINSLQASIVHLKSVTLENKNSDKEIIIQYKIKYGDYPAKIAQFFYNDWRMYKKIESDNNLKQPYELKVGQILFIKIKQQ